MCHDFVCIYLRLVTRQRRGIEPGGGTQYVTSIPSLRQIPPFMGMFCVPKHADARNAFGILGYIYIYIYYVCVYNIYIMMMYASDVISFQGNFMSF